MRDALKLTSTALAGPAADFVPGRDSSSTEGSRVMTPLSRVAATSVTLALTGVLLTGCGAPSVEPVTTATARLDRANGQIIMPLDEYRQTPEDEAISQKASQAILRECLQTKGENGLPDGGGSGGQWIERPYGLWLPDEAAEIGFVPTSDATMATEEPPGGWSDETSESFNRAYEECKSSVGGDMAEVSLPDPTASAVEPLVDEAYELARKSPEWEAARTEWKSCLADAGLTPPDQGTWMSQEAQAVVEQYDGTDIPAAVKKEEIRLAVIEATCNEQTQLTQRLADLEAGFQAALIKDHEAQLAQEKSDGRKYVDAARAYLAGHQ